MAAETNHGLKIVSGNSMTKIRTRCEHQSGVIYVVPSEKSWVCSDETMPGHALAGFLGELTAQKDKRVQKTMQRWGIYYREMPLEEED